MSYSSTRVIVDHNDILLWCTRRCTRCLRPSALHRAICHMPRTKLDETVQIDVAVPMPNLD